MNKILFKFSIFEVNLLSLVISIAIILILTYLTHYLNKNIKQKRIGSIPKGFLYTVIWIFGLGIIAILLIPKVDKIILINDKNFNITLFKAIIILLILFVNLFFIRLIKLQSIRKGGIFKNKTLRTITDIILWLLSIHFILLLILKHYKKFSQLHIISIKNITITIYDIFLILIALAITEAIIVAIKIIIDGQIHKKKIDKSTGFTIYKVSQYIIWIFAILYILQSIGFNISLILAGSAALLVGLGIGIQQIFNDIISGIVILFEQNIKVGDIVEVGDDVGKVLDIGFRTTTILTRDNIRMIIPNSKFTSENVINWSKGEPLTRFYVMVGVAYGSDTQLVEKLLLECAQQHPEIDKNQKPEVIFDDFADSSLNFKLYFYTRKSFYVETIKSDLRKCIDKKFRENNITIPFPQQDIYIKQIPKL